MLWTPQKRSTGRGYGTAAARALTTAVFRHLPEIDRVEIHCDAANLASAAIPRKLGYTVVGERAPEIVTPADCGRQLLWALTRREWEVQTP